MTRRSAFRSGSQQISPMRTMPRPSRRVATRHLLRRTGLFPQSQFVALPRLCPECGALPTRRRPWEGGADRPCSLFANHLRGSYRLWPAHVDAFGLGQLDQNDAAIERQPIEPNRVRGAILMQPGRQRPRIPSAYRPSPEWAETRVCGARSRWPLGQRDRAGRRPQAGGGSKSFPRTVLPIATTRGPAIVRARSLS